MSLALDTHWGASWQFRCSSYLTFKIIPVILVFLMVSAGWWAFGCGVWTQGFSCSTSHMVTVVGTVKVWSSSRLVRHSSLPLWSPLFPFSSLLLSFPPLFLCAVSEPLYLLRLCGLLGASLQHGGLWAAKDFKSEYSSSESRHCIAF